MNPNPQKPIELKSEDIQKLLPHRYPFLLIDRVVEINDTSASGYKNVSHNEPFFQGHFPGKAVMPGVLIVEAMAQLAGIVSLKRRGLSRSLAFLTGVDGARFREPVVPGDRLDIKVTIVKEKAKLLVADCVASVGEKRVCEAQVMFALIEE